MLGFIALPVAALLSWQPTILSNDYARVGAGVFLFAAILGIVHGVIAGYEGESRWRSALGILLNFALFSAVIWSFYATYR